MLAISVPVPETAFSALHMAPEDFAREMRNDYVVVNASPEDKAFASSVLEGLLLTQLARQRVGPERKSMTAKRERVR